MCQFTMEYSIVVLLLMSSAVVNSQGYHSNFNNRTISTAPRSSRENLIYHNDIIERSRHKLYNEQQFEKIFDHYRSDRREPRFISFQTKDDNIEVEIDFAIPFLSIPVRRSLSGAMGTLQNVIKGIPMANINVGAVILTGVVIFGGTLIGGIGRLINGGSFLEVVGLPWFKSKSKKQKNDDFTDESSPWWIILDEIDKALLKYDFDSTACTQRVICWYVKESIVNIEENRPSGIDYLIETLSSSEWLQNILSNTAWNTAINVAKRGQNCETTFSTCKLSPSSLDNFTRKIMNYARRK